MTHPSVIQSRHDYYHRDESDKDCPLCKSAEAIVVEVPTKITVKAKKITKRSKKTE